MKILITSFILNPQKYIFVKKHNTLLNTLYFFLILIFTFGLIFIIGCGDILEEDKPEGACVYGPSDLKYCINSTFKDECENDFRGVWYEGKSCDEINYWYVILANDFK